MRDGLTAEIAALKAEESRLTNKLSELETSGPLNIATYSGIQEELKAVQGKLAAKRSELEKVEGAEETAQTEVAESFDSLHIPGSDKQIPLSYLLATDGISLDDKITIITSAVEQKLINAAIVRASLESENKALKEKSESLVSENEFLAKRNDELDLKASDLEAKLHNAATQLDEEKKENERKGSEIEKLREQLSKNAAPSQTGVSMETAESIAEALAKRPAIYGVRWADEIKHTHYLANRAENDEEITIPRLEIGLWRTLNDEELLQFRKEKEVREAVAAAEAERLVQESAVQSEALVTPPIVFPTQGNANGLAEEASSVAGSTVSREEFQKLANRVLLLEQSQRFVG